MVLVPSGRDPFDPSGGVLTSMSFFHLFCRQVYSLHRSHYLIGLSYTSVDRREAYKNV